MKGWGVGARHRGVQKWKRHSPGVRVAVVNVCGRETQDSEIQSGDTQDSSFTLRTKENKRWEEWNYGIQKTA